MPSKTLMIQGATSDAGKSIFVAGLCRVLKRQGYRVAPFKPQNMALNSAVTVADQQGLHGEIGRAQAVQAQACGLPPCTDMNPILLKPNSDTGSQVIVHGRAIGEMNARQYHDYKPKLLQEVLCAFERLKAEYDWVIIEGAGSPAEINLREHDIANMGFAEAADCPVAIIADIDRGGVFAHLTGTLSCLSDSEKNRVNGFIINRFRGDISLLQPGIDWLNQKTNKPTHGVLPYLHGLHIEAEDSIASQNAEVTKNHLKVVVPVVKRISNHTDFDVLRLHPQVELRFVRAGEKFPPADLIILPGSKSVRSDLAWLRDNNWHQAIARHLRYGGKVFGICGGYQMLGEVIHDPQGIESQAGSSEGLAHLDMETTLMPEKQLKQASGCLKLPGQSTNTNIPVSGYEIHAGISTGKALQQALLILNTREGKRPEGAISADGQVAGSYLHGIFDQAEALEALLAWAGLECSEPFDYQALQEKEINRLADAIEAHIDLNTLLQQTS